MRRLRSIVATALALAILLAPAFGVAVGAPERPREPLGLEEAIAWALAHHPRLRTRAAVEEEGAAEVALARTALLPSVDLGFQLERGTANVVPGSTFAQPGLPNTSGPPTGRDFDAGVWGTAASASAWWDALGVLGRMARVDAALAERDRQRAGTDVDRLSVAAAVADAFLGVVARGEAVRAAKASVERARVFADSVRVLVANALRPGADQARAEAERALAETLLARAEQSAALAAAELAQTLGVAGERVAIEPGALLRPAATDAAATARPHPLLVEADAAIAAARAREHAVSYEYLPRLALAAALWVRGSGKLPGGPLGDLGAAQGLVPDTPNWATGIVVSWPALELFAVRARAHVEEARRHAAEGRREELAQEVASQIDAARATLEGADQIAARTPVALAAAQAAERQATARYQAGLGTAVEVAEADRLLAQAEIDDAVARLGVWHARLLVARALGDLDPFLAALRATKGGR